MFNQMIPVALLLWTIVGLTACAAVNPEAVVQPDRADAVIAAKIKGQLIEDESLDAAAIRVVSEAGAVTLDGFVDNPEQKQQAETLALEIDGVTGVDNQLQIR